jgi:glycosyltransferase involved in cell wall biosynthesis
MARLLIISAMPHHTRNGRVVGWGPTVKELDHLATRFESVRHIACLSQDTAPGSAIPYSADNIELVPVPPAGGSGLLGKLDVLRSAPLYLRTILRELPRADMVHVRAPANIALIAMILLALRRAPHPRWFKYAGNWRPNDHESPSYAIQRWWLERGLPRGIVTVNGTWDGQPAWVRTFYNPSLEPEDIARGRNVSAAKTMSSPIRLLFVGRVESAKGANRAIEIVARLAGRGIAAHLELIGDGEQRVEFEELARTRGVHASVTFSGWQPPPTVHAAYERAHVLLLPTKASEGWPKVLSEGMAYGVVPVAGAVSSIPQYLRQMRTGAACAPDDVDAFVSAIARYQSNPTLWKDESQRAVEATRWFSFDHYLSDLDRLLGDLGVSAAN